MIKKILSVLVAFFVLVNILPIYGAYGLDTEKEVSVWYLNSDTETKEEADNVELYRGGELYLSAVLHNSISGNIQWQIEAEQNYWVDIQGGTTEELRVSYSMVKSLLNDNAVRMRCAVLGDTEYYSDPFTVAVTDENNRIAANTYNAQRSLTLTDRLSTLVGVTNETESATSKESSPVTTAEAGNATATFALNAVNTTDTGATDEDVIVHNVTIEYIYADSSKFAGQRVALPYIAEVASGSTLNETVSSPNCVGYTPNISSIDFSERGAITSDLTIQVEYSPAEVSYTVRHYLQNVDDDEYTWADTTIATGYTESLTSDNAAKTYAGFTALTHYHEEIAADSSTMIDIYYDRNYYLMSFDLDGGYGVEAVYARYGADISVSDPQRAGYSFKAWSLDGTTESSLPGTMPEGNSSYTALWTSGNTSYTIAYWLENADTNDKYDFVGSVSATASSGDSVSGSDNAVANNIFSNNDRQYYAYNSDKTDKDITVAGDGSTVVNVYYDRNEYTLKFYYARLEGTTYDIASNTNGSSNNGGTAASATWVGNSSTKPTLDSQYTEQTEVIGGNTYYFFTITAKYGADLSALWPNAPLSQAGDYKFISWGTHYGSGYYKDNSNKNIKGVYSLMDSGLLIDPAVTADQGVNHWMVGYWATKPTMYTYEIYYSLLANETADRTYNGVGYKKINEYTVGSTAGPEEQTELSFNGVTYVGKDYDSNDKVRFYYQRTKNTVTLDDNYGNKTTYTIPYGDTLSSYITSVPTPAYPAELPDGAYEFGGWYQSKEGIGVLDTNITMPNEDLIYYALWTPKVYTVTINSGNVNNDGDGTVLSTQSVSYGSKATKPSDPTMENATFIGWYYNSGDGEQRFDFDNMTITQDMTIYAKWRSNVMKNVQIYYVVEKDDGTKAQVADTETLMLRLGQTRTFEAKTGNSLYEEYRTGCFPTTASHSITPTDADIESSDPITYTFVYKQYGKVPYQVEFYVLDENGERPAFKEENGKAVFIEYDQWDSDYKGYVEKHWNNDKAVVTELYIPDNLADSTWTLPDKYLPNALKIQKIIIPSDEDPENNIEANVIKFVYTFTDPVDPDDPDNPVYKSRYLVQHYIQNVSNTDLYDLHSYSDETGYSGETATGSPISIPGYTYSYEVTGEQNVSATLNNGADGENGTSDDTLSGTITADDSLELNFYYTANSYPYQVMYLEQDTNRVLAAPKTTDSDGDLLTALYSSKVTESAIDIDGYDIVGDSSKSIYIQMEAGDTASVNTIVFYYKQKSAELEISKNVELDETQAAQEGISEIPSWVYDQEFEFTISQPEGFSKSVYHYTFTDANNQSEERTVKAGLQTIVISLKHGETARFHDFPMGTYTVTETYVPGFKATVDNYIAQAHTITLNTDDEVGTLNFVNRFPFYTGDLVIKKNVTKQDTSDPDATEPYKVTVQLEPDPSAREVDRVITFVDENGNALTDANNNSSFTIPKLTGINDDTTFTIDVLVPVGGEVKMQGVPVGTFTATEQVKGTIGYIYDFYTVKYNKAVHQNDEVTGTDYEVSGSIHGGHPTAVTFNNKYKKGDLTINKTVTQEYVNDSWTEDTFTFTVTGTTELPDGDYNIEDNEGNKSTVTVTDGQLTFSDEITISRTDDETYWTGSLSYENMPAGYYTVTETADLGIDKYNVTEPGTQLVNNTEAATVFEFENEFKRTTGNLQVGKEIRIVTAGSTLDTNQEFTFVVEPKDSTLADSYTCTVKTTNDTADTDDDTVVTGSATSLNVNDGKLTFKLKHNQYILIEGLPVGDYLVKEEAVEGYDSSFGDVITNAGNYSVDPATITTNNTTVLNCQNAYPVYYSNLIVKKNVITPESNSAVDQAPTDDEFTFIVGMSGYSDKISLVGGISAKFYENESDTTAEEKALTVTDNTITFTLKAGEWVDLNLPACVYTIEETGLNSAVNSDVLTDHYLTAYTVGGDDGIVGDSYTLVSGEIETVEFTNTYKRHYQDLTITTDCSNDNQSFIFTVSGIPDDKDNFGENISQEVVLVGDDSQTIKNLPNGVYTVTEQTKWSWREADVNSETVELRTQSVTVPFDFDVIDRIYWLSGYSYDYNLQKKGGY